VGSKTDPSTVGIIGIILLFVLLALGVPVAWSLGVTGFLGLLVLLPLDGALNGLFSLPWNTMSSYTLLVLPLFIIMGALAFHSGLGVAAFSVANKWFGWLPGGLAVATAMATGLFAAVTGSSIAAASTIGKTAIPEMEKYGYDDELNCGAVAACGTFGILIPPSVTMVIYGIITEQSIGRLFFAGFIPGIITILIYAIMIVTRASLNPSLGPPAKGMSWRERIVSLREIWTLVVLVVVVLGGMYTGIFTVTEAAAVGCLLAALLVFWKAKNRRKAFRTAFRDAAGLTGMLFGILWGVTIFSGFILLSTIPARAAEFFVSLPVPRHVTLIFILFLYIPMGMLVNPSGILFITLPVIFTPIVALGFDPIWFGIIIVKLIEIALITPPVGLNVFAVKGIAPPHVTLSQVFRGIAWFLVMDFITLAILVAFPQISLWLPSMMWK